jgi:hypothetical protein
MDHNDFINRITVLRYEAKEEEKEDKEDLNTDEDSLTIELDKNFIEIIDAIKNSFAFSTRNSAIKYTLTSGITALLYYSSLIKSSKDIDDNDLNIDSSDIRENL